MSRPSHSTTLVVSGVSTGSLKCSKKNNGWMDKLNPKRKIEKTMSLRLKSQHKMVKKCASRDCFVEIKKDDYLIVQTTGVHEFTDKNGTRHKKEGLVYLHFLESCLKSSIYPCNPDGCSPLHTLQFVFCYSSLLNALSLMVDNMRSTVYF